MPLQSDFLLQPDDLLLAFRRLCFGLICHLLGILKLGLHVLQLRPPFFKVCLNGVQLLAQFRDCGIRLVQLALIFVKCGVRRFEFQS